MYELKIPRITRTKFIVHSFRQQGMKRSSSIRRENSLVFAKELSKFDGIFDVELFYRHSTLLFKTEESAMLFKLRFV